MRNLTEVVHEGRLKNKARELACPIEIPVLQSDGLTISREPKFFEFD